jgi:hypothetical protein
MQPVAIFRVSRLLIKTLIYSLRMLLNASRNRRESPQDEQDKQHVQPKRNGTSNGRVSSSVQTLASQVTHNSLAPLLTTHNIPPQFQGKGVGFSIFVERMTIVVI